MTPLDLLNTLVVQGFQLTSDGAALELRGPLQRLAPELRQAVRDNKTGLLELLAEEGRPVTFDWPGDLTFADARKALATAQAPEGWQFASATPLPKPWPEYRALCRQPEPLREATETRSLKLPTVIDVKDCPEGWQDDESYVWIGRASKRLGVPIKDAGETFSPSTSDLPRSVPQN